MGLRVAAAACRAARAQQQPERVRYIGILTTQGELQEALERQFDVVDQCIVTSATARKHSSLRIPALPIRLLSISVMSQMRMLPSSYTMNEGVFSSCLLACGPYLKERARHGATYLDKILKGTQPGGLPVEQTSRYELTIKVGQDTRPGHPACAPCERVRDH